MISSISLVSCHTRVRVSCAKIFSFVFSLCDFMVLFITNCSSAGGLSVGQKKRPLSNQALDILWDNNIFKLCKACINSTMASIPPSAFSAGRIRETQRDKPNMKMAKTKKMFESSKYFDTATMELSPVKYNSKLMNSIWGFYNRYSPHNVKKVNDDYVFNEELQQTAANSANKAEPVITLPPAGKLDSFLAAFKLSQTHQ